MQTYLFYDIETTGLNKAFDQVLHFAAIRTDLDLNEIERYEVKIKLNPDLIPSPYAMITHHIGISESLSGETEYAAIRKIHEWMNTPGTISLGYNTLGFDDEFLRFSFYRNLLSPYTHQYMNQCGRMDLYPIATLYALFNPEVIQWPTVNGEIKLKLELLNEKNAWVAGRSHHAMVDVEATLALAKCFKQAADMWTYITGYFNKQIDQTRFQQLPQTIIVEDYHLRYGLLFEGILGAKQNFLVPVLCLGEHTIYKNQMLWLRLDTETLSQINADNFQEHLWVIRKKWGEPGFVLPPKDRFLNPLSPERLAISEANTNWLKQNSSLLSKIIQHYRQDTYTTFPDTDAEASLYLNGFWSAEEMAFCKRFHETNDADKPSLLNQVKNPLLKTLCLRLIARNFPDSLSSEQMHTYLEYAKQINPTENTKAIFDFKGHKRLSPNAALAEIEELQNTELSTIQSKLLNELTDFIKQQYLDQ